MTETARTKPGPKVATDKISIRNSEHIEFVTYHYTGVTIRPATTVTGKVRVRKFTWVDDGVEVEGNTMAFITYMRKTLKLTGKQSDRNAIVAVNEILRNENQAVCRRSLAPRPQTRWPDKIQEPEVFSTASLSSPTGRVPNAQNLPAFQNVTPKP